MTALDRRRGSIGGGAGRWAAPDGTALGWFGSVRGPKPVGRRDHRRGSFVDGVDDLGVVDPAQVRGGDRRGRHARAAVGSQPAGRPRGTSRPRGRAGADAARTGGGPRRGGRGVVQLRADAGGRARPAARRAAQDAEQRADRQGPARSSSQGSSCSHAQRSIPTSRRFPPLPWRTRIAPATGSRSVSASASASLIRSPARHSTMISAAQPDPVGVIPGGAHDRDDLLDRRRVRRIAQTLVAGRAAFVEARERRRRPAPASTIQRVEWIA